MQQRRTRLSQGSNYRTSVQSGYGYPGTPLVSSPNRNSFVSAGNGRGTVVSPVQYRGYGARGFATNSQVMSNPGLIAKTSQASPLVTTGSRYVGERVIGVQTNRLQERVVGGQRPEVRTHVNTVETWEDQPIVKERFVEKQIEVIREQKVQVEKYVDVPYDVYVEKPIEKIIEKEIQIEKYVDVPYERIVEVPVEKIVERPVERIVHKPVEVTREVRVPYERIVHKKVEVPVEKLVYHDNYVDCDVNDLAKYPGSIKLPTSVILHEQERIVERPVYRNNIITKDVEVPVERVFQVPVEKIVHRPVEQIIEKPVYIDNIIEREVQIPVEKIREVPVEHIVERAVYKDNIIERPVPVEVIREETVEVPVEHIVEKPVYVDNIINIEVENIIENPVAIEKVIELPIAQEIETRLPVEAFTASNYDITQDIPVQIDTVTKLPIEYVVRRDNPVLVESILELDIPTCRANVHEKVIERPVDWERIVQKPIAVEKIVEVEVERVIENATYVERIIKKRVVFDRVIESTYDVIVQNIVEVPVEKILSVPIKTFTQSPNEVRNHFEKDINVNSLVIKPVEGGTSEMNFEVNDELLAQKILDNRRQISQMAQSNMKLKQEASALNVNYTPQYNSLTTGNAKLKAELSELESRLNIVDKDSQRLQLAVDSRTIQSITYTIPEPSVMGLSAQLEGLVNENRKLASQAVIHGDLTGKIIEANRISASQIPMELPTTTSAIRHVVRQSPKMVRGTVQTQVVTSVSGVGSPVRVVSNLHAFESPGVVRKAVNPLL